MVQTEQSRQRLLLGAVFVFLIVAGTPATGTAQPQLTIHCSHDGINRVDLWDTGFWEEIVCKDGQPNGPYRYGQGDTLLMTGMYENGKARGLFQGFSSTNPEIVVFEGYLKDGEYDGEYKTYNDSGSLVREAAYVNGKEDGVTRSYFSSGNLQIERSYKDGVQDGIERVYNRDGGLVQESTYVNGRMEGFFKQYYANGQLAYEAGMLAGMRHGTARNYDEEGRVVSEELWDHNTLIKELAP